MELSSASKEDLKVWLKEKGYKPFIADQIFDWIYVKKEFDFSKMSNLKNDLREELEKAFQFPLIKFVKTEECKTGEVTKFLWKLGDGKLVESVLIRSGDRRTVCVSSQVGCNARCAFCASGKEGFFRNLSKSEIVEQILQINLYLKKFDERVSHIVFMGMGEPLENYDNVVGAIRHLIDPETLDLSPRKITISTVGIVDRIEQLKDEGLKVNLVLSLHAPNQHVRKKIIPYARKYDIEDILNAMENYTKRTKRDITYEYILIEGVNAEVKHADELARLLKGKQCTVNLIPYNPVDGFRMPRPSKEKIEAFRDRLQEKKIPVTWRYTKGKDIAAACGQLALKKEGEGLPIYSN